MSIPRQINFQCPKCGESYKITVWDSINTIIPTSIQDVISGDLFRSACPHCGQVTNLIYPCLLNDMKHQVMIQLQPSMTYENEEDIQRISALGRLLGRYRIVTSQEELSEKASIFNDGFDDRIIELCKIAAIVKLEGKSVEKIWYHTSETADLFDVKVNNVVTTIAGNTETYAKIADSPEIMEEIEKASRDIAIIDSAWAKKMVAILASKGY